MCNETGKHIFLLHYFCTLRVLLKNSNAKHIRVLIGNRQNREPIETRILYIHHKTCHSIDSRTLPLNPREILHSTDGIIKKKEEIIPSFTDEFVHS